MTARNPWELFTPLDARALGAMAWAPPQWPLFPRPQPDDNAGAGQAPSDLDRARSAAPVSAMGVFDRGLPVSGLGMSLPVVGLDPADDGFGAAEPLNRAPPAEGLDFNFGSTAWRPPTNTNNGAQDFGAQDFLTSSSRPAPMRAAPTDNAANPEAPSVPPESPNELGAEAIRRHTIHPGSPYEHLHVPGHYSPDELGWHDYPTLNMVCPAEYPCTPMK